MGKGVRLLVILFFLPFVAMAQSDFGIWYSAGAEKKLSKKWNLEFEGEFRTRNNTRTVDRWDLGIDAEYKIAKVLKAAVGYTFLNDNFMEKITYHENGGINNYRPSYWGIRHRLHFDLTGNYTIGRVKFSLRERWQYTYRPSKTTERFDYDNYKFEDKSVDGKGKNVLRSRLLASWDIRHCKIEPYANVETFNSWKLTKLRYTVGGDWKVTKKHIVGVYFRFQDVRDNDAENEPDSHIVGIDYKFKF